MRTSEKEADYRDFVARLAAVDAPEDETAVRDAGALDEVYTACHHDWVVLADERVAALRSLCSPPLPRPCTREFVRGVLSLAGKHPAPAALLCVRFLADVVEQDGGALLDAYHVEAVGGEPPGDADAEAEAVREQLARVETGSVDVDPEDVLAEESDGSDFVFEDMDDEDENEGKDVDAAVPAASVPSPPAALDAPLEDKIVDFVTLFAHDLVIPEDVWERENLYADVERLTRGLVRLGLDGLVGPVLFLLPDERLLRNVAPLDDVPLLVRAWTTVKRPPVADVLAKSDRLATFLDAAGDNQVESCTHLLTHVVTESVNRESAGTQLLKAGVVRALVARHARAPLTAVPACLVSLACLCSCVTQYLVQLPAGGLREHDLEPDAVWPVLLAMDVAGTPADADAHLRTLTTASELQPVLRKLHLVVSRPVRAERLWAACPGLREHLRSVKVTAGDGGRAEDEANQDRLVAVRKMVKTVLDSSSKTD